MREIHETLLKLIQNHDLGAYCTVVQTNGSTPQKPGSKLLILPNLRNIGTLGGGCVEAEARRQAIGLMDGGTPRLLNFQLDSDYGWDDGLICGGSMKIFIDLPKTSDEATIFAELRKLNDAKVPIVLATVVKSGITDIEVGMKMIRGMNGERLGTLGNLKLDEEVESEVSEVLAENSPGLHRTKYGDIWVFLDPIQPRPTLLIAGAGHVGQALCHLGSWLDFDIAIVDDRPDFASKDRLPEADEIIVGDIADELKQYPINHLTYAVIVTRGHQHDEEALHSVIESGARYVGLIGSRRKIKLILDDLSEMGVSEADLARVYAPIGVDITSKTVPEIAVSIAAQLIQVRNAPKPTAHIAAEPATMPTARR